MIRNLKQATMFSHNRELTLEYLMDCHVTYDDGKGRVVCSLSTGDTKRVKEDSDIPPIPISARNPKTVNFFTQYVFDRKQSRNLVRLVGFDNHFPGSTSSMYEAFRPVGMETENSFEVEVTTPKDAKEITIQTIELMLTDSTKSRDVVRWLERHHLSLGDLEIQRTNRNGWSLFRDDVGEVPISILLDFLERDGEATELTL